MRLAHAGEDWLNNDDYDGELFIAELRVQEEAEEISIACLRSFAAELLLEKAELVRENQELMKAMKAMMEEEVQ